MGVAWIIFSRLLSMVDGLIESRPFGAASRSPLCARICLCRSRRNRHISWFFFLVLFLVLVFVLPSARETNSRTFIFLLTEILLVLPAKVWWACRGEKLSH